MGALAALCVRRPVFTWVLALSLLVLGLASFRKLDLERYPSVDFAFVSVTVAAPGLGAAEVEREVTARVEDAVSAVSGLERVDSTSQEGFAVVLAQFDLARRSDEAAQEVREKLARVASELPVVARPPQVEAYNPAAAPVVLLTLWSPGAQLSERQLTQIADDQVARALRSVNGVGEVRRFGGRRGIVEVALDPARLAGQELSPVEVQDALSREDLTAPGGEQLEGSSRVALRLAARARSPEALADIVIARRGERAVRLGDVATLQEQDEIPSSSALINGDPGVVLGVVKRPGGNTVRVVDELRDRLRDLQGRLPPGVELRLVRDESVPVRAALSSVEEHLVLGALFATLAVLAFLRSWRATLIAALAIPVSVVGTFAAVKALGLSLNAMTLLGLTLAVGIVIDDAIVVLENVVRVLAATRLPPAQAAVAATREIALAVLATTLSLVAVFLPVAFLGGIVGRFLASFSLTMTVSILLSMLVAFTLTPMLCARWLRAEGAEGHGEHRVAVEGPGHDERSRYAAWARGERREVGEAGSMEKIYGKALAWLMGRPWLAAAAILAALATLVPLGTAVSKSFLPTEDEGRFEVYLRLPEDTALEQTAVLGERVARQLRGHPGVTGTTLMAGSPRGDASGRGPHEATIYVTLRGAGLQDALLARVRAEGPTQLPPGSLLLAAPVSDFGSAGPEGAAIQFVLRGPEDAELERLAQSLLVHARGISGTVDHGTTRTLPGPQWTIRADRVALKERGLTQADVAATVPLLGRTGVQIGSLPDGTGVGRSQEVWLRVASPPGPVDEVLRRATLRTPRGALVPMGEVAVASREEAPGQIRRTNRERQITVFMNTLPGTSDDRVVEELQRGLAALSPAAGYRGEIVGNAREMEKAAEAFVAAVVLSVTFMYLILAAQFESWLLPVTILASLPLTVPFALLSLVLGGQSLNLFSGLGFLVLFGIVKKNSILQVEHMEALRKAGLSRADAVIVANRHRLRPILMTTLAFVAGLVPLVVSGGAGAGVNRAIGVGVLGGQTLSLLLTLLVTPMIYTWLEDLARRVQGPAEAAALAPEATP